MTLRFDSTEHRYWDGEREMSSVTTILRETGLYDGHRFAKQSDRQRGEAVHLACRLVGEGVYDEAATHEVIRPYAAQFREFVQKTGFRGVVWETPFFDTVLGVGGTPDVLGEAFGEVWLVDLKSGALPDLVGVQLAAYELLIRQGKIDEKYTNTEFLDRVKRDKVVIKRKSLNLGTGVNGKDRLRSHDERKYDSIWRSALTIFHTRKEYGL